jgi:hypothetical protein
VVEGEDLIEGLIDRGLQGCGAEQGPHRLQLVVIDVDQALGHRGEDIRLAPGR